MVHATFDFFNLLKWKVNVKASGAVCFKMNIIIPMVSLPVAVHSVWFFTSFSFKQLSLSTSEVWEIRKAQLSIRNCPTPLQTFLKDLEIILCVCWEEERAYM